MSSAAANEILCMSYREMERYSDLRLGQAIINVGSHYGLPNPWPELFYEECPVKASEIFYAIVENGGKRKLTGRLNVGDLLTLPENRH